MTQSVLTTASSAGVALAVGATNYFSLGHFFINGGATEAARRVRYFHAGTFSDLYVRLTVNGATTNSTLSVRNTGVNTAMTITIAGGATGEFEESTKHTATIAANDYMSYEWVTGATAAITNTILSVVFSPTTTTNTVTRTIARNTTFTTASSTLYDGLVQNTAVQTVESNTQFKWKKPGTIKNLYVYAVTIRATSTTLRTRKNTANGNLSVTITGTAPLEFQDTANSDTIAVDDLENIAIVTGTGTTSGQNNIESLDFISTKGDSVFIAGNPASVAVANSATSYNALSGSIAGTVTTESDAQMKLRIPLAVFSNLSAYILTNGTDANSTIDLRKNAVSANNSITIGGGATGWFHDTTHQDVISSSSDELNYRIVNGGTAGGTKDLNVSYLAVYMTIGTPYTVFVEWEEA